MLYFLPFSKYVCGIRIILTLVSSAFPQYLPLLLPDTQLWLAGAFVAHKPATTTHIYELAFSLWFIYTLSLHIHFLAIYWNILTSSL